MKIGKTLDEKIESLYQGTRKTISLEKFKKGIEIFINNTESTIETRFCKVCKYDGWACCPGSKKCRDAKIEVLKEYKIL